MGPNSPLQTSGGHHWRPVKTCSLEDLPPPPFILTSSGGYQNTYGWQAGGTHPTGMLSCLLGKCISRNLQMDLQKLHSTRPL